MLTNPLCFFCLFFFFKTRTQKQNRNKKSLNEIYSWDAKKLNKKRSPKKKTSPHAICVTCRCHHRDNMDIGLIWCWVSILQRNKEVHWSWTVQQRHMKGQRGRTERTGPGCVMLSSLLWRIKTIKTKKHKQEVFLNHYLLIQIFIYLVFFFFLADMGL